MSKNWYIVTNTEDLTDFINYGLIFDEQGFTGSGPAVNKTKDIPKGYISCFSTDNLSPALEKIKTEDKNLDCCLLELDIKQISGFISYGGFIQGNNTIYSQKQGCIQDLEGLEDINCILIPAPLPFICIKTIIVEDDNTKKKIQGTYKEKFGVNNISFRKMVSLFKIPNNNKGQLTEYSDSEFLDIGEEWKVEQREIDYSKVFAYGGALGLLYYQTKNGRESTKIFKIFSDLVMENSINDNSESLKPFKSYLLDIQASEDSIINIYKLIVYKIINTTDASIARFNILNILKNVDVSERYNIKCKVLAKRLEEIIERTIEIDAKTIFESIINKAYADDIEFKNLTLLITMFFLRDNVDTMLKYYHSELTETHYSLLAIFFGMSYCVVNIPDKIRKIDDFSNWLSYKMAEYAHGIEEGMTVKFKEPAKPGLIYDDFIKTKITRSYKLQNFYHWLSMDFYKREDGKEQNLIKWGVPLEGNIEKGGTLTSYSRPQIAATIEVEVLEKYIQQKIKEDTLFDSNEIILAYKKYTK